MSDKCLHNCLRRLRSALAFDLSLDQQSDDASKNTSGGRCYRRYPLKVVQKARIEYEKQRAVVLQSKRLDFLESLCLSKGMHNKDTSEFAGCNQPNTDSVHRGNSAVARPLFLLRRDTWALKNQRVSKKSPRFSRRADASSLTDGVTLSCHISACKSKLDTIILRVIRLVGELRSGHATFSSVNGSRSDHSTLFIAAQPEPAGAAA